MAHADRARAVSATVLVVEDEPDVRLYCRLCLEGAGYRVIEADRAETALALLAGHDPDAMVTDLSMPGIGGLELLHRVSSLRRFDRLPVVVMSARHDLVTLARAHRPACRCLPKPFHPRGLLEALDAAREAAVAPAPDTSAAW
jgi:CheY-like chemotaxis protein